MSSMGVSACFNHSTDTIVSSETLHQLRSLPVQGLFWDDAIFRCALHKKAHHISCYHVEDSTMEEVISHYTNIS